MDGPGTKPNDHASAMGTHHQAPIHLSIRQPIQTVRCAYNRKKRPSSHITNSALLPGQASSIV